MCINGFVAAAVLDENHIAIAILNPRKLHYAFANRSRRGAGCRSKVGTQVRTPCLQNRVKTHGKSAADA